MVRQLMAASWLWSSKLAAIESKRRGVCSLCCRPQPGGSALGKKQCHHPEAATGRLGCQAGPGQIGKLNWFAKAPQQQEEGG